MYICFVTGLKNNYCNFISMALFFGKEFQIAMNEEAVYVHKA